MQCKVTSLFPKTQHIGLIRNIGLIFPPQRVLGMHHGSIARTRADKLGSNITIILPQYLSYE